MTFFVLLIYVKWSNMIVIARRIWWFTSN